MPAGQTKAAVGSGGDREFLALDWKPMQRNTLQGFVTIVLPSGLRIRECSLHEKNGKRWVSLPGKPWTRQDGTTSYVAILDFADDEARFRFQRLALAAIDEMLGGAA
jgi:hypothetical protein